ncbi:MAG: hypothetical protein AVO34_10725 [Firmicutes bacterium ML8_F2]|nr:MAG: hypothetical protein AVO34_10725 [Firmicutes bacterium ML8_F2]
MENFAVYEKVQERISVHNYSSRPVEDKLRLELETYIEGMGSGPFGTRPRFKLLDLEPLDKKELRSLGTYGFIRSARLYLQENKPYNRFLGKIRIQNIDMGIAMCHFALVAEEQNLPGW